MPRFQVKRYVGAEGQHDTNCEKSDIQDEQVPGKLKAKSCERLRHEKRKVGKPKSRLLEFVDKPARLFGQAVSGHREWTFANNVLKAFRSLPEAKQVEIKTAFETLLPFVDAPEDHWYLGYPKLDMRGVLSIMLAEPGLRSREIASNMTDRQTGLLLHCADYSIHRLHEKMGIVAVGIYSNHTTKSSHKLTNWISYYNTIKGICEHVHDFAADGGVAHVDEIVAGLEDWITTPKHVKGNSLLKAMCLTEPMQFRTRLIETWSLEKVEVTFGPAVGGLLTVLSYFMLALWVSAGMAVQA
ncbi:hypothetical protein FZEAL_2337 [Fusarium zealandicum]|uniref:Uncharacterized protein n=1 Tax=Fusarium zealandicum TaxID=1053134 RepID=A0A8H4URN7_9HYPO|nr:hypothetical protein FZEAL_2337 [Fusarium zealandicum]